MIDALLAQVGILKERANHYANFHFLRLVDNRNKTDKPPHEWFANPGPKATAYTDEDLHALLIERPEIQEGQFETLIEKRGARIRKAACEMFHTTEDKFNAHFE